MPPYLEKVDVGRGVGEGSHWYQRLWEQGDDGVVAEGDRKGVGGWGGGCGEVVWRG